MTHDEFVVRSCTSKVPFMSRREARQRASSSLMSGRVIPYACKFGDHWHLGHSTSKSNRKRNRA